MPSTVWLVFWNIYIYEKWGQLQNVACVWKDNQKECSWRHGSYVIKRGQFISEKSKESHSNRSKRLLNKLKNPAEAGVIWFFLDEKNFDEAQKINRSNDRWLCSDLSEVPKAMCTKFPSSIMVLGVVSNERNVMSSYFIPLGFRINAAAYIELLETIVKSWINSVCNGRLYIFQQDLAPSHKAQRMQEWIADNPYNHITLNICPPNSPDFNSLNYYEHCW